MRWLLAAWVLVVLQADVRAQGPGGDGLEASRTELIKNLEPIPAWCQENGLFRERDRAWRIILSLSSDHAAARKALMYTRAADGSWRQSASYREPKTTNREKAAEFAKRWNAAVGAHVERTLTVIADKAAGLTPAARGDLLAFAVELAPEDVKVREARGEAKSGNRWLLAETVTAVARRKELAALAAKLATAGKPSDLVADESLKIPGIDWKFGAKSGRVMALATPSKEDATITAQQGHAALELVDALFEGPAFRGSGATVYLVGTEAEAATVIGARPIPPDMSEFFLKGCGGAWLRPDTVAVCHDSVRLRADTAVRALIDRAAGERFNLPPKMDVLSQGLTVALMGMVSGTRSVQAGPRETAHEAALSTALNFPGADWEKVARESIRAGKWPKPAEALAATIPNASPSAQLYGEIATSFLVLGCPDRYQAAFKAIGPRGGPGPAIASALDTDLDSFDLRLRRWLQEMSEFPVAEAPKAPK